MNTLEGREKTMKVFDEGMFMSILDMEIAKNERFDYPFTLISLYSQKGEEDKKQLLNAIIDAEYRMTDVVGSIDDRLIVLLGIDREKLSVDIQMAEAEKGINRPKLIAKFKEK